MEGERPERCRPGRRRRVGPEGILASECATDLHDVGLEKVYVAADEHPGLDLD